MSAPGAGHSQGQQAKIREMIPMKMARQGTKELVEREGHTYNPKHEAILPEPMVNGRLHTLRNHGPRMASPAAAVKTLPLVSPQMSVNMSKVLDDQRPSSIR